MTGFGVSWVNSAADYSRYLPRTASTRGVVGWPTFGGEPARGHAARLRRASCGSDAELSPGRRRRPDRRTHDDPADWFLVPFAIVAVGGLVSGAVLDIYSSGLTLLTLGLPTPRWVAAALDGVIMILGTIYIVWIADDFLGPFMAFLITLGVPIAAWCGIFLADLLLRRRDYDDAKLFDAHAAATARSTGSGRCSMVVGDAVGWGSGHRRHRYARRACRLAGLPARTARPRRPRRPVGLRQPRRPRCSRARLRRLPRARSAAAVRRQERDAPIARVRQARR